MKETQTSRDKRERNRIQILRYIPQQNIQETLIRIVKTSSRNQNEIQRLLELLAFFFVHQTSPALNTDQSFKQSTVVLGRKPLCVYGWLKLGIKTSHEHL